MRDFEKISFEQFKKDIKDDIELYNLRPCFRCVKEEE